MEEKKAVIIGGVIIAAGIGILVYKKYQANVAASNANSLSPDAAIAQMMLQPSLVAVSSEPVTSTTPTVDTGNSQFQSVLSSILNPPATTQPTVDASNAAGITTHPIAGVNQLPQHPTTGVLQSIDNALHGAGTSNATNTLIPMSTVTS